MADVIWTQEGPTATITIERAGDGNSLTTDVLADLREALSALEAADVTAIVLRTAGEEVFSVGADLEEVGALDTAAYAAFQASGRETLDAVEAHPAVVVAAVEGAAVGGGTELVCATDLAVATKDATFALPEVSIGLVPGGGATQRLPRLVGPRLAMAMLTTGEPVTAEAADRAGLINRVVDDDATGEASELARTVGEHSGQAVAAIKQLVRESLDTELAEGLDKEAELSTAVYESGEARERIEAFLDGES